MQYIGRKSLRPISEDVERRLSLSLSSDPAGLLEWEQPADVWAMSASRAAQSAKVRVCIDFRRQELAEGEFARWKP